jgi:transposase
MSTADVANAYQTHRVTIHRWLKRFKADGLEGLVRRPGSGRPRVLQRLDAAQLRSTVLRSALSFGYESDLWTCRRLQETIHAQFGVCVSKWTVWRRLREVDLTYKKPERRYIEASLEERRRWRQYTVPQIKRAVRKFRAILYFQDEANISLTAILGKTWAPRGQRVSQEVSGKRGGVAAMSAISGIGKLIFQLHEKRIDSDDVINFLSQMLCHHPRRHLVVVMDRAGPHTSQKTTAFIANQSRLHVFYLPKYSPDWNPDEKVWNHLKNHSLKGHRAKTRAELRALAGRELTTLSNSPTVLRGIFFRCCVADLLH